MHVRVESSHAEQRVEERNVSETVATSRPPPPGRREAITGLLSFKLRDSGRPATHMNGKGAHGRALCPSGGTTRASPRRMNVSVDGGERAGMRSGRIGMAVDWGGTVSERAGSGNRPHA